MVRPHDIGRTQNAVCLQCKSTPVTYYWGENRRGLPIFGKELAWQASVDLIRANWPSSIDYGTSCNHCHDPHKTTYRLVRKQMINTILERGTDPYDATRNYVPKSVDDLNAKLNERDAVTGALTANAKRLVGTLTCAQCHVEYTCGPGVDKPTGPLRDEWPWRKLRDLEAYYKVKFDLIQDWVHSGTGLRGIKIQHPETEFFWESDHYKRGATCADCHMAKTTKERSHWFTSPLKNPAQTCGATCHTANYLDKIAEVIPTQDLVMNQAKLIEQGLEVVLLKIDWIKVNDPTFDAAKLLAGKEAFMRGLLFWEYTVVSENSAGFHNPKEAKTNLDTAQAEIDKAKTALGIP